MQVTREPKYEEQFTAFIDFLGFSEASTAKDESARLKILALLQALSQLRGEFDVQTGQQPDAKTININPAVSTFSDHIVISYPLEPIFADTGLDEHVVAFVIMGHFTQLLSRIAAAGLRIGFLIRGGATIGKLYHARGVVFGEALVDAFLIESRTSIYPRVVLSPKITRRQMWIQNQMDIMNAEDGLRHFNYFRWLILNAATPGETYRAGINAWLKDVVDIVSRNVAELEGQGRLKELAKWGWFAREFRRALEGMNPGLLKGWGVSLDTIPWPR